MSYHTTAHERPVWNPEETGTEMPLMVPWLRACSCALFQQSPAPSGAFLLVDQMQTELFEAWRAVPGYEGYYEVSSWGRLRSLPRNGTTNTTRLLKLRPHPRHGYVQIGLRKKGVRRWHRVHQLVLSAFVGPKPEGMEINHVDGNKANNHLHNVHYCTRLENRLHAHENGLYLKGEDNPAAKLTEDKVRAIRRQYAEGGLRWKDLADEFGVGTSTIGRALKTHWRHVV